MGATAGGTGVGPAGRAGHAGTRRTADRDELAVSVDAVAVLVFVLLGRTSHREGSALAGTLGTAWPFLAGCALGWLAVLLARRRGAALPGRGLPTGAVVLLGTVLGGMLLRRAAGEGTPVSFVLVATSFLALFLVGWRAVVRWRLGPA